MDDQLNYLAALELMLMPAGDFAPCVSMPHYCYFFLVGRVFYGPGGPYHLFAGKDASRALAKMSFEEKDLTGDISGLGVFELEALQDWEYKFMSKYVKVGTVKSVPVTDGEANGEATKSSSEATSGEKKAAETGEHAAAKATEDGPSENVESKTDGDDGDKKE